MKDFDVQYKRLNAAQREAVDIIEGPVVVVAGPGTGKTQILTLRIANILKNAGAGIGPENILALTFTNAGAAAMRTRLATFIGATDAYRAHIFTFHGFCERQITDHPDYFPHIAFARAAGDVERMDLLARIVREGDFTRLKTFSSDTHAIAEVAKAIDEIKRIGSAPEDFMRRVDEQQRAVEADPHSYYKRNSKHGRKGELKKNALKDVEKNRELAQVYVAYQELLRAEKLYDFADMIVEVVRAVEHNEEFAAMLREQYQYILVDEHQDTNDGQNRLLELLLQSPYQDDAPNIFTVGDDKQAIYRFQGASVENFHHFKKRFTHTKVVHLDTNYRATQNLLDTAQAVVTRGGADTQHQGLVAHSTQAGRVRVMRYRTYADEVRGVVGDIAEKIAAGTPADDIAVFCRSNFEVHEVVQACEKMHVPYIVGGTHNVLDNPYIGALVRLLRAVDTPMDDACFAAALLTPFSGVALRDALVFLEQARTTADTRMLCILADEEHGSVQAFAKNLLTLKEDIATMSLEEGVECIVRRSRCVEILAARPDHATHFTDFTRLMEVIAAFARQKTAATLTDFIGYLEICEVYGIAITASDPPVDGGVHLMTAHAAKGLEFEHVYVMHAINGVWGGRTQRAFFRLPIDMEVQSDDDERRLFYVALTRAKRTLTITLTQWDKNGAPALPTMFLEHFPTQAVDVVPKIGAEVTFAPRLRPVMSLLDPTFLHDRFLAMPLSVTAMNNYFCSPLLYFFRTIVRLPTTPSKSLLFGNVLHGTLEEVTRRVADSGVLPPVDDVVELFHDRLRRTRVPRLYREEFMRRGEMVVRGYYHEHADALSLVGSAEQRITNVPFVLDGGQGITLTGAIDKITPTDDGRIVVTDYKTGKSWTDKNKEDREKLIRQMRFYKLLLDNDPRTTHPQVAYVEINFIEPRQKNSVYETKRITVTDEDVRALKEEINTMARNIMSGAFLDIPLTVSRGSSKEIIYYARLLEIMKHGVA